MAWEEKLTFKERFTKERFQYAFSVLPWGFQKLDKHYKRIIFLNAILNVVPTIAGLYLTVLSREIINAAVGHDRSIFMQSMMIYVLVSLFNLLFNTIYGYYNAVQSSGMLLQMRKMFYRIIFEKEYGAMERFRTGELLYRIQNDIPNICNLLYSLPSTLLSLVIQIVGSAYLIFKNVPEIGLIAVPLVLFMALGTFLINDRLRIYAKLSWEKSSASTSVMIEHIRNLMLFHTFGKEEYSYKEVSNSLSSQRETQLDISRLSAFYGNISNIFMMAISVGGMFYFLSKVLNANMNIGTYTMLISLVERLKGQISQVSGLIPIFFNLMLSSERTSEIEHSANDLTREKVSEEAARLFYDEQLVSFGMRNVYFAYPGRKKELVLEDFSVDIKKGEFVATTGLSGCGKSTMQKLLLGLYRPDKGELYLKKKDGSEEVLDSAWRELFSYVPQQNFLFYGTIRDVVRFGSEVEDPNDEKCWQALRIACAENFVKRLPEGLDTELGENGAGLSEGQMQRLSIARAIYTERPILLLDECTSSLDGETERKTLENIKAMTNKTVVIVTHRPAALDYCDCEIHFQSKEEKEGTKAEIKS
ncbi:MAG: ABC transporter ATP-binding protein [Solobacterium sp.]|nr:ABC transporter ATP-binding protein [Solobacterium sp.]